MFLLQDELESIRATILDDKKSEDLMGGPLSIFPALCRRDTEDGSDDGVYKTRVATEDGCDDGVYKTGVAMGIAFAWTVADCIQHEGDVVTYENDSKKRSDGFPLHLKRSDEHRPFV